MKCESKEAEDHGDHRELEEPVDDEHQDSRTTRTDQFLVDDLVDNEEKRRSQETPEGSGVETVVAMSKMRSTVTSLPISVLEGVPSGRLLGGSR